MLQTKQLSCLTEKNILIFSGGSGCRGLAKGLKQITHNVSYILPVSDNGGSTGEIMKWFDGPSIGDIRSRLSDLRANAGSENEKVSVLLGHRIEPEPSNPDNCFAEWTNFVRGRHALYEGISAARTRLITRELRFMNELIMRQAPNFNFYRASIGNLFLSGIRIATGSLESAILLYSDMAGIQEKVIPVINTNKHLTIAAKLANGTTLYGQNEISHPACGPIVDKEHTTPLSAPISKLFYIDREANAVLNPPANPNALSAIAAADLIVFSIGSFWTSIMPMLILPEIGKAIAKKNTPKIMILNGSKDRETSQLSANNMLRIITNTLNRSDKPEIINNILSGTIYLPNGDFLPDPVALSGSGILAKQCRPVSDGEKKHYYIPDLIRAIGEFS